MKKTLYLLSNAHLDPVWQWEWEEGAAAALSTFRCAADFCEEFDGYVFNHNEALLYRWVEEYEPALFERIRRLVREGRWHIMGGWFLQPDCNMPSGEAFVRQILEGRLYFREKFGAAPTTAINFDPFGHSRGLVQILKKSGFDSYLFCRPNEERLHLPDGPFVWVGCDGSTLLAQRLPDYGSQLGKAAEKIRGYVQRRPQSAYDACLWGVGDHGGGASRRDLADIATLKEELAARDVVLLHATPEDFFARVKQEQRELEASGRQLPRREGDLNLWAPGCYTSQIRIKQKYRQLENELFSTEKMAADAERAGMAWPAQEFGEAVYDLLTVQFHDSLPGSSIQPVEEMVLRKLDHALEQLSRIRTRAFFALSRGQRAAAEGEIPILVYNPHPWPVEGDFTCEMMLWDQNWDNDFHWPQVWQDGRALPTQCEKEDSNLPLDWRKRVVFHAVLAPMQMNRFDCTYTRIAQKPVLPRLTEEVYRFDTPHMTVEIDRADGTLRRYAVSGTEYLQPGGCSLDVLADNEDPWGMTVESFEERIGTFALMTPEAAAAFCGVCAPLDPVHLVEDGPVRTVVEALLCWGASRAVMRYTLSHTCAAVEVSVRVQWAETHKMLKLRLPSALQHPLLRGQVAYGEEPLPMTGRENVAQRYAVLTDGAHALTVLNDGTYGLSGRDGVLWLSLLRSPAYTAHPIGERRIIPQDRYSPHIEQGERLYRFCLLAGDAAQVLPGTARRADAFGERPMALSFFPAGEANARPLDALLQLTGDDAVQLPAVKRAADGRGLIVRLFNPTAAPRTAVLQGAPLAAPLSVAFGPFEIVTLRLLEGEACRCDLLEQSLDEQNG